MDMRNLLNVVVCAGLLTGCGVEVLTTTAITGELQAQQMSAMKRQLNQAGETSAKVRLEQAVRTYQAERGVNPPSLEALVPDYLAAVPTHPDGAPFGYDPVSGKVSEHPAEGVRASDQQQIRVIEAAITRYGTDTGYYPGTLSDLVPYYLPEIPLTRSGQPFLYNNQTGYVGLPGGVPQAGGGNPGGGMAGETGTALGVQNDLNNMNASGANAAGGYGRRTLDGASGGYGKRQEQALDDLGL